ncbi:MAG TPA: rhomboid family intramembrane serine protease [Burkholderiales bacterium]
MFGSLPPVTRALLIANFAVFLVQGFADDSLIIWFALWPFGAPTFTGPDTPPGFLPWQIVTYSFLHGNSLHLLVNMLGLFMFGSEVERVLGVRRYFTYYLVSVLSAAIAQLVMSALTAGPPYPTVGASGGVFGLLLAYGMFFPHRMVMLIFPPIPMPARVFVIVYAAIELYLGVTGTQAGVAHFAHLGGMLGGFVMLRRWRRRRSD